MVTRWCQGSQGVARGLPYGYLNKLIIEESLCVTVNERYELKFGIDRRQERAGMVREGGVGREA